MYKVFFNGTSFTLCANFENSFKDNKYQAIEIKEDTDFTKIIQKLEETNSSKSLTFISNNIKNDWKKFTDQFICIKAAGGLVRDDKKRILTIKRLGVWDLAKGKIEKRETPEQAAIREVEEECGISGLKITHPLGSVFHIYRSPYHPAHNNLILKETFWFEMYYCGNEVPKPQLSENIEEVCWFHLNEMDTFFSNTYPNLKELMETYLKGLYEKKID